MSQPLPRRRALLLIPAFVLLAALIACSDDDTPSSNPTSPPAATSAPESTPTTAAPAATTAPTVVLPAPDPIEWSACNNGWECAEFAVPIDYSNPDLGDLTLALTRLPAGNPDERIGSLFFNPGGPGASAVEYLRLYSVVMPVEIKQRFDLVAFDPRGVGGSSPIRCADDLPALVGLDPEPATDAEWQGIIDTMQAFADLCAERAGAALPFYGTQNVARDMDRIRQALGEDTLNYLGYSYGTSIGQVYADMFPTTIRAMVLDGVVDNSLPPDQRNLEQILGFEAALGRFIAYCDETACFAQDARTSIETLIQRAGEAPIPAASEERPLTQGEVVWGLVSSLYARFQWGGLANAINDALGGDGSRMIRLVDNYWGRNEDGSYDNLFDANIAVNCLDQPIDGDPDHHRELSAEFAEQAPIFGAWGGYLNVVCALWGAEPTPLSVPTGAGAPPILLIGNTGDAATPYKGAHALSQQLESAVLLTNDAEGHTAYLQGSNCVEDIVNAYLIDLEVPEEGTTCGDAGIEPVPPIP